MTVDDLRRTSDLLRLVAAAEVARIEGDDDRVASLLNAVDPVEAVELARRAEFDAASRSLFRSLTPRREPAGRRTVW